MTFLNGLFARAARAAAPAVLSAVCAVIVGGAAQAEVAATGTFTPSQACPAFKSMRQGTNPGAVMVAPNTDYAVIAQNKMNASHYRVIVDGAFPPERWVSAACGAYDANRQPANAPASASANGARATHVLAMSWEPAFCVKHSDKKECGDVTPQSYSGTHLSLHGLWPQPRGTQYCNVASDIRKRDQAHDWDGLPEPEITPDTLKRLSAVMPGVQSKLPRHEWIVHGTCYGTNADTYFARAASLAEQVNGSRVAEVFAASAGKTLSADTIRAAFDESFGAGTGARVTVSCTRGSRRVITEIVVSLAGEVNGSAGIGDLMRAAQPVDRGCPGGLVTAP